MTAERIEGQLAVDGRWTIFQVKRRKGARGNIEFDPDDKGGPVLSLRIRDVTMTRPTADVHWCGNENGHKVVVPDVLEGTRFVIHARGSNGATKFSGTLYF